MVQRHQHHTAVYSLSAQGKLAGKGLERGDNPPGPVCNFPVKIGGGNRPHNSTNPHGAFPPRKDRGIDKPNNGLRFSAETLFSVPGFVRLRGRGRSLCPRWCSILSQGGKAASPASASPWRTPANRCRTRLFSASKSAGFRGSQQPLGAFPLEEPGAIFPHPAARIDKEKGPWYNVHDPTWVALVSCLLAGARAFLMPR